MLQSEHFLAPLFFRMIGEGLTTVMPQAILDCSETNEGFYVKCGYKRAGLEMAHYYDKK